MRTPFDFAWIPARCGLLLTGRGNALDQPAQNDLRHGFAVCAPICVSTGLWKMPCLLSAKGAQASTSMPSACKASTCACRWWKELISIWFICGMVWLKIPKSTARSGVKLLTPMVRTQPRRPGATLAARAVGGRGRASGQIGSIKKGRLTALSRYAVGFYNLGCTAAFVSRSRESRRKIIVPWRTNTAPLLSSHLM